jgi:hypothetical protein
MDHAPVIDIFIWGWEQPQPHCLVDEGVEELNQWFMESIEVDGHKDWHDWTDGSAMRKALTMTCNMLAKLPQHMSPKAFE